MINGRKIYRYSRFQDTHSHFYLTKSRIVSLLPNCRIAVDGTHLRWIKRCRSLSWPKMIDTKCPCCMLFWPNFYICSSWLGRSCCWGQDFFWCSPKRLHCGSSSIWFRRCRISSHSLHAHAVSANPISSEGIFKRKSKVNISPGPPTSTQIKFTFFPKIS